MRATLVLSLLLVPLPAQAHVVERATWRSEEVGVGVTWRHCHFAKLFDSPQNVNLLEIDFAAEPRPRVRVQQARDLQRTSAMASPTLAIAAVNGGFYDTKTHVPLGLVKSDGKVLHDDGSGRAAIAFDQAGKAAILGRADGQKAEIREALAAGPLLVSSGVSVAAKQSDAKRHPRTALGLTKAGKLICLTVDGRATESAGMSFEELATTLQALGCVSALNLDGGGSTTLWVRGKPDAGVVNCPCDDKRFDHLGERAVANALLIEAADVVVADDADAMLEPAASFARVDDPKAQLGSYRVAAADAGAVALWQLSGMLSGRYRVLAFWPKDPGVLLAELGEQTLRVEPRGAAGRWFVLGEVDLSMRQQVRIRLARATEAPLVVDAVRLLQIR